MTKKVLTAAAAGEIRRLRTEMNDWGEPRWSGAEIADQLGVSESTVWRVIRAKSAYAPGRRAVGDELSMQSALEGIGQLGPQDQAAAQASLERVLAATGQARLGAEVEKHFRGDAMVRELRNPLEE